MLCEKGESVLANWNDDMRKVTPSSCRQIRCNDFIQKLPDSQIILR